MDPITATVALNLTEQIIIDHRESLETAIGKLPLRLLSMTWDADRSVVLIDVEYSDSENELDQNLVDRIISAIEQVLPSETIDDLEYPQLSDEILGEFIWDDHWWEGRPELPVPFDDTAFHFSVENPFEDVKPLLKRARDVASSLTECDTRWREMIVSELFEIYNRNWNTGTPATMAQFLAQISLSSVVFYADGLLRCYYGAGDLFREHDIELTIDPDGSYSAGLVG